MSSANKYKIPKVSSEQIKYGNKNVKGIKIISVKKAANPLKKYTVEIEYNGEHAKVHFGAKSYQHYKDVWQFYSTKDHLDKERRHRYLARASGILDKNGKKTCNDPFSPNFWSIRILW